MSVVTYDENVGFERAGPAEIPFRIKFKAWWNGYDPIDLCPKLDPIAPPAAKEEAAPAAKPAEPAPLKVRPWSADRIAVVERLWGKGFHTPGGGDHLQGLVKPMALDVSRTLSH